MAGPASVLEEFSKEFGIPCNHAKVVLPYDEKLQTFNIDEARKHHEFLYLLQEHKKDMEQLVKKLSNLEKGLVDDTTDKKMLTKVVIKVLSIQESSCSFKLSEKMWAVQQSGCNYTIAALYVCQHRFMGKSNRSWNLSFASCHTE